MQFNFLMEHGKNVPVQNCYRYGKFKGDKINYVDFLDANVTENEVLHNQLGPNFNFIVM